MKSIAEETIFRTLEELQKRNVIASFEITPRPSDDDIESYTISLSRIKDSSVDFALMIPEYSDELDVATVLMKAMKRVQVVDFFDVINYKGSVASTLSLIYKTNQMDVPLGCWIVPYPDLI